MIHLVRHGETAWSLTRQHTGTTDIDLTPAGERQAEALAPHLARLGAATVVTSPLLRARRTCELAGFAAPTTDPRLVEWNYGEAEGRTTAEIRESLPGWSVWTDPLPGAESVDEVGTRCDLVIDELREVDEPVLVFAHAHLLRVFAARWCGLPAINGRHLVLDPASLSTLGFERETPTIERWNVALVDSAPS